MGKRIVSERQQTTDTQNTQSDRSARKRKRSAVKASRAEKCQRLSASSIENSCEWHENDDEDSSSSGSATEPLLQTPQPAAGRGQQCAAVNSRASLLSLATFASGGHSDHNNSNATDSPRPVYTLRPSVVNGTILRDVLSKAWRLGRPIGKGNFGEIFLASDDTVCPVSSESAKYVVKIEPHSNGPLFVEIHCLINTNQTPPTGSEINKLEAALPSRIANGPPSGIPSYIASGTHYFGDGRYRFLVLPRYDRDLHSLVKNTRVAQKSLLVLAVHILNVLEHLHDKGYCHNDIKAQNLMISKCKYLKRQPVQPGASNKGFDEHYEEKQQTTDSGNSSEQETNDDDYYVKNDKFPMKRLAVIKADNYAEDEDEDFDDGATTNSNNSNSNSNSMDMYHTPVNNNKNKRGVRTNAVEFSGSNPMRSCRRNDSRNSSSMYEEMVKSHYLRPSKRVSYSEFFNEDGYPLKTETQSPGSSDNEWDVTPYSRRLGSSHASATALKRSARSTACNTKSTRSSRRQLEKQQQQQLKSELNDASAARNAAARSKRPSVQYQLMPVVEEHIFLIDFGLASKYQDRGVHRPFIMDQRRAHDGTLEFTSRDAHLGAHSRRSDLECLGYNLLYWSEGYLPWKDVAQQQQQEKVHRAKELFMTDVCEMLRQFYGKQVPKYLGEFLQQIGSLGYQERPNYERYRNIFKREYRRLGYDCSEMRLSSDEIHRTRVSVKDEVDGNAKCDIFELNTKVTNNVMRNSTFSTPFQEHSLTNRVSPKNLRSKSEAKNAKKKKFSWAEVLSQDPDQIARERAVKEFEREEVICPLQSRLQRRYEGKPTYAIIAVEQCRRDKGLAVQEHNNEEQVSEQQDKKHSRTAQTEATNNDNEEEEDDDEDEDDDDGDEDEDNDDDVEDEEEAAASEDEEMEQGEASEATELLPSRGRGRRSKKSNTNQAQQQVQQQQPLTKSKSSRIRTLPSKLRNGNGHSSHSQSQSHSITPLTAVGSNKRGCATRKENATLASATGEVEHNKLKSSRAAVEVDHHPKQRRPRRCLYKTEAQMRGEQQLDVENNSNYAASNMQHVNVYSGWQYDDENSYGKGRNVNSSRHCRK
ncbi:uncharacterized protein LOC133845103 isoform X2 [Drosophila sulfurigaster albostrigata]|uniref:uncharacterized protein LOC133845103 isoform X2 n=1 Tax=Drosophila sulfurigaster albostrigata TaxID=89887 RepID=UPI002D21ACEF|nr:uncharacterized protein LOC133845103 isoform X2 [Drosophila sulfurigaster albostrigata]